MKNLLIIFALFASIAQAQTVDFRIDSVAVHDFRFVVSRTYLLPDSVFTTTEQKYYAPSRDSVTFFAAQVRNSLIKDSVSTDGIADNIRAQLTGVRLLLTTEGSLRSGPPSGAKIQLPPPAQSIVDPVRGDTYYLSPGKPGLYRFDGNKFIAVPEPIKKPKPPKKPTKKK